MKVVKLNENVLWTNPQPVLRSRNSFFPYACQLDDGTIFASHVIGEAFESIDGTTRLSVSRDGGITWDLLPEFYDKSSYEIPTTDFMKPTNLGNGKLLLFGYEFFRENPQSGIGNPETGGVLDCRMILLRSGDNGKTWTCAEEIPCRWGRHAEASAPLLVLSNGDWAAPVTEFPKWDGGHSGALCGRLLRSADQGKTWDDETVTMRLGENVSVFEQRICQLEQSEAVVVVAWNEDLKTGKQYNNHFAISYDCAKTFQGPFDTGIYGQASSVCAIGGNRLLALHAVRRDTERPGIYAYVVNLENGKWEIESESVIWEPVGPMTRGKSKAEIFSYLKFGQPSAIKLSGGKFLASFWAAENGQYNTYTMQLTLE